MLIIIIIIIKSLHRHYRRFGRKWLKRWFFKCLLKSDNEDADLTFGGRVFHSRAAATGKARSPMVERRVRRTTSDDVDADRRKWRASSVDDWWNSSARYGGAVWCRHLYTRTASLNSIRFGTLSQCNCVRSGVMRRTSMQETQAEQQNSTPTASDWSDGMQCQPALWFIKFSGWVSCCLTGTGWPRSSTATNWSRALDAMLNPFCIRF